MIPLAERPPRPNTFGIQAKVEGAKMAGCDVYPNLADVEDLLRDHSWLDHRHLHDGMDRSDEANKRARRRARQTYLPFLVLLGMFIILGAGLQWFANRQWKAQLDEAKATATLSLEVMDATLGVCGARFGDRHPAGGGD